MKLEDQIVLISGAGRGLGAAIARAFASQGACVVINYRRSEAAAFALAALAPSPGGSVIMAETSYTYTSPIGQLLSNPITMTSTFYSRPRRSVSVARVP